MNAINLNNSLISAPLSLSWLAAGVLAFSALHASANDKNLLEDGSFEKGSGSEVSEAWSVKASEGVTVTREKNTGGSGDWVLKIHIPDGTKGWNVNVSQNVDLSSLKAGDAGAITAVVKVEGNGFTLGHAGQIFLVPKGNRYVPPFIVNLPQTFDDWKEVRRSFILPEEFDPGIPYNFKIVQGFPPEKPAEGDQDIFVDDIQVVAGPAAR